MKFRHVSEQEFKSALQATRDAGFPTLNMAPVQTATDVVGVSFSGTPKVSHTFSVGATKKNNKASRVACSHAVALLAYNVLQSAKHSQVRVWAAKNKFYKFHSLYSISKVVQVAYAKKGVTCLCAIAAAKPPGETPAPAAPTPTTGTSIDAPALDVPAITIGTGKVSKGGYRDVLAAVTSLYVMQEVYQGLTAQGLHTSDAPAVTSFLAFKSEFETALARNLFDFLTVACVGELRHHHKLAFPGGNRPNGRSEAYTLATTFDPRTILPVVEKAYDTVSWSGSHGGPGSGYGGPAWAKIARAACLYFTMPALVFIDHVVDLAHNGGIAFNKGYLVNLTDSEPVYLATLDRKRNASLLEWEHTLKIETPAWRACQAVFAHLASLSTWQTDQEAWSAWQEHNAACPEDTWRKVSGALQAVEFRKYRKAFQAWRSAGEARGLTLESPAAQLVQTSSIRVTCKVKMVDHIVQSPLQWGMEPFSLTHKAFVPTTTTDDEPVSTHKARLLSPRPGQMGTGQ